MLKHLAIGAAFAALLATGALAQNSTTDPAQPANPPAAAPAAPAAAPTPAPSNATAPKSENTTATTTTTTTTTSNVNFKSAMAQDEMLASKITGLKVRNSAGDNLGDINDVVLDKSGKVSAIIVGVGGFLGLGEKAVGVPFEAITFADATDGSHVGRLDTTKDALNAAPTFVYKDTTSSTMASGNKPKPMTQ
jgi:sporulation protein YlmC with PRC-barrel domain